MALAKLYRVTDVDGQGWFVAASSFGEVQRKFTEWEVITEEDNDSTEELIDSIAVAGDLILGGNRDDSIGNYQQIPQACTHDWADANRISAAGTKLIKALKALPDLTADVFEAMKELDTAIDTYEAIPF